MSKLRVHELAKELGRQNKEVIEFLKSRGVEVRSHMSMVDEPLISVGVFFAVRILEMHFFLQLLLPLQQFRKH